VRYLYNKRNVDKVWGARCISKNTVFKILHMNNTLSDEDGQEEEEQEEDLTHQYLTVYISLDLRYIVGATYIVVK
jgi:hypothetical protein